jgi:S1-C subfamily serine protease
MKHLVLCLCVVSALIFNFALQSYAQVAQASTKLEASSIYEKASPSVVFITCVDAKGNVSSGSGVILRADGIIATNFHVISDAVAAKVQLSNSDIYDDVSVLDTDERKDIAILKIKAVNLPALSVADSDSVKIGATVYAIGSPRGLTGSLSSGIVSSLRPASELSSELTGFRIIQFTAPASPGSSGGALLDDTGKLLGLVFANKPGGQNLNAAIPVNYVAPLAANAKGDGRSLKKMPNVEESTATTSNTSDDYEYGKLSELKGIKKIFIDTGGETAYRERLIKEIEKAKLNIEVLSSPDNAECFILFRNTMINEPWFSGSSAIVEKSLGKAMIVIPGNNQKKPRLLLKFTETKDSYFEDKPIDKFAKLFVKAYREANPKK